MKSTVAIMMTVHNCREKTLSFLDDCYRQIDAMKGEYNYSFSFYVVDDGSVDGTSDEIENHFPEVRLIRGDGKLYWSRGMYTAWKEASLLDYDFYFWVNVNTVLKEGALVSMMENSQYLGNRAIIAGTAANDTEVITAGGRTRTGKFVVPDKIIPVPCFTISGNLVLIPRYVYKVLGNIDYHYRHALGDLDYGVRAYKTGIVRVVAPGIFASYSPVKQLPKWCNPEYSLKERYACFLSPKGNPPKEQFLYDFRSAGFFHALVHFLSLNIRVLFAYCKKNSVNIL